MIRTVRKVLSDILDMNTRLTDDILHTLHCELESIVNGRPLTKLSDDIDDPSVLTPNPVLLLREGPITPPEGFSQGGIRRRRWRQAQFLADVFWRRWVAQYLPELQQRQKWQKESPNVSVGDVVLVMNEKTPGFMWPLGFVLAVREGRDSLIPSVSIRTKSGELVRPVTKIVCLEC